MNLLSDRLLSKGGRSLSGTEGFTHPRPLLGGKCWTVRGHPQEEVAKQEKGEFVEFRRGILENYENRRET